MGLCGHSLTRDEWACAHTSFHAGQELRGRAMHGLRPLSSAPIMKRQSLMLTYSADFFVRFCLTRDEWACVHASFHADQELLGRAMHGLRLLSSTLTE